VRVAVAAVFFCGAQVENNIVRCPDESTAEAMIAQIDEVRNKGDSCGGVVTCVVRNCPKGLGAPVFHKLEADLAFALMSIPATKVRIAFRVVDPFGTLPLAPEVRIVDESRLPECFRS
jgi:chorismate synthase